MDAGALGGLCSCRRDQVLATDDRVPQGGTQQSDWQRAVQAIPGTDLGEGVLKPQFAATTSWVKRTGRVNPKVVLVLLEGHQQLLQQDPDP